MRTSALLALSLLTFVTPGLAATSAGYGASTSSCPLYHPLMSMTGPTAQSVVSCRLDHAGTLAVAACDAMRCTVVGSGSLAASWSPPGYGYAAASVADYVNNASAAICAQAAPFPSGSVACSGTSMPLAFAVAAGQCVPVWETTSVVFDYLTTPNPLPYYAAYLALRIDHEFALCRDAAGTPSLALRV